MRYRSYANLSDDIREHLWKIQTNSYDLVVGIPRSGMVPAYIIGLHLNCDVTDFGGFLSNIQLQRGIIRKKNTVHGKAHEAKRILLVDDSILSGRSLRSVLKKVPVDLRSRIDTLVVYADQAKRKDVDFVLSAIPEPRVFEWNIFHRDVLKKACVDIDGVLCLDPTEDQNDDGVRYVDFLETAQPFIIPTHPIHSLVTNRLEKYRRHTEAWLKINKIEYQNLIMLDLPTKKARQEQEDYTKHKAEYFASNPELEIFIESDFKQARQISTRAAKAVYCLDSNLMLEPGLALKFKRNWRGAFKEMAHMMLNKLPYQYRRQVISRIKKIITRVRKI
jgi:hypoxanthine phosphoribosyltransferase